MAELEKINTDVELKTMCETWLAEAEPKHTEYVTELDEADRYRDNIQEPASMKQPDSQSLVQANDPLSFIQPRKDYVVINQIIQSHENIIGNFLKATRTVTFFPRTDPRDMKKAAVIVKANQSIEDRNRTWERVVFPAFDTSFHRGLGWSKTIYNGFRGLPNGTIEEYYVSARDVMVDPDSVDPFYEDTKYRIHRVSMDLSDARKIYGDFIAPDTEAQRGNPSRERGASNKKVTIYEFHWKELADKYHLVTQSGVQEISKEQFDADQSGNTYQVKDYVYYSCQYHRTYGIMRGREVNPFGEWILNPCINRRSERRVYPIGDFAYYKNLQDLFNVLATLVLNDVKRGRKMVWPINPAYYEKNRLTLEKAFREGGPAPIQAEAVDKMLQFPGLNEGVLVLLNMVQRWIQDIRSLPTVARGELPAKQISTQTVDALLQSAIIAHGRKDTMLNMFLVNLARIRTKIISTMWRSEDWIKVVDASPGMPGYAPINLELSEDQYMLLLAQMSGITVQPDGSFAPEDAQRIQDFKKKFETTNTVEFIPVTMRQYGQSPELYDETQHAENIRVSGQTAAEFTMANDVSRQSVNKVVINQINPDIDVDLFYRVDFDTDRTKQRREALAVNMLDRQLYHPLDAMHDMDVADADGKFERASEYYPSLNVAKKITENPEFAQAVEMAERLATDKAAMETVRNALSQLQMERTVQGGEQ